MRNAQILMLTGGLLVLLTGLLILIAGWMGAKFGGLLGVLIGMTAGSIGMAQIITGMFILVASVKYHNHRRWAIVSFTSGLIALLSGGGFFIGALLAIAGSFSGFAEANETIGRKENARKKASSRRRR